MFYQFGIFTHSFNCFIPIGSEEMDLNVHGSIFRMENPTVLELRECGQDYITADNGQRRLNDWNYSDLNLNSTREPNALKIDYTDKGFIIQIRCFRKQNRGYCSHD